MSTTTMWGFWYDVASTTGNIITANWQFFAMVFMAALVIMLLGGLIYGFTKFWRRHGRR